MKIFCFIFFIWVFFHEHSRFTGQQGCEEATFLTPLYHFYRLHRHIDISRVVTAESSPLYIPSNRLEPEYFGFLAPVANHYLSYAP